MIWPKKSLLAGPSLLRSDRSQNLPLFPNGQASKPLWQAMRQVPLLTCWQTLVAFNPRFTDLDLKWLLFAAQTLICDNTQVIIAVGGDQMQICIWFAASIIEAQLQFVKMRPFLKPYFSFAGLGVFSGCWQAPVGSWRSDGNFFYNIASNKQQQKMVNKYLALHTIVSHFLINTAHIKLIWEGIGCICRFRKCVPIVRVILGWWSLSLEMIATTVQTTLA